MQARDTAAIIARERPEHAPHHGRDARSIEEFQATAKKVLAVWLAQQRPDAPPGTGEGRPAA